MLECNYCDFIQCDDSAFGYCVVCNTEICAECQYPSNESRRHTCEECFFDKSSDYWKSND